MRTLLIALAVATLAELVALAMAQPIDVEPLPAVQCTAEACRSALDCRPPCNACGVGECREMHQP